MQGVVRQVLESILGVCGILSMCGFYCHDELLRVCAACRFSLLLHHISWFHAVLLSALFICILPSQAKGGREWPIVSPPAFKSTLIMALICRICGRGWASKGLGHSFLV